MLCSKLQVAGQAGWVGLHLWNSWQRCVGRRDKHFFLSFQSFNLSTLLPHFIAPCLYFTRKVIPFFRPNFRNSWRQRCVGRGEGGQAADYFDYRPSTRRTCGHKMKVFPKYRQKTPFGDKMSFCQFLGKRLPINTIGGNPCRCWSGVSGSIKLPDYKTFSGMNTGGRGGGGGGAQTKTLHKIFLLEKHKVLSFFLFYLPSRR